MYSFFSVEKRGLQDLNCICSMIRERRLGYQMICPAAAVAAVAADPHRPYQ